MIVRKTTPQESLRTEELFAICFEQPMTRRENQEEDDTLHWAAFTEDGEMMSTFCVPDYRIHFDGHDARMAGIGGVATLPQYRRRGGIRACFEKALPDLYDQGCDFSYLYPFSTHYYRKFGYECCVSKYLWRVDLSQLKPEKAEGTFRLQEPGRPMTDAIRELDSLWQRKYNMMVFKKEEDYRWTEKADPAATGEHTYICFGSTGEAKAYATYRTESGSRDIRCSRLCFRDREGFSLLMTLFASMASDHGRAVFYTPAEPGLRYLLPEWSLGAASWELQSSWGMARVINAQAVLGKAKYRGTGEAAITLIDDQIPQNNGTFRVKFVEGKALEVSRVEETSNVMLTIQAFSALITGTMDWEEAVFALKGVQVVKGSPDLSSVFYRKPLYITECF